MLGQSVLVPNEKKKKNYNYIYIFLPPTNSTKVNNLRIKEGGGVVGRVVGDWSGLEWTWT